MKKLKMFIKELKRIRWISFKETNKVFLVVTIFIIITSLILFFIAIGFTSMWSDLGVGLNG